MGGGADGNVLPEPAPVAGFTAEEVARAQRQVKAMLVASRLAPAMLERGDAGAFVRLFAPSGRAHLRTELRREPWPVSLATRIAPGSRLLPVAPKVRGTMRAEPGDRQGELRIRTNYVFAYAFDVDDPSRARAPLDLVTMLRADVSFVLARGDRWRKADQGFHFDGSDSFVYSMACGPLRDEGLLAPAYLDQRTGPPSDRRPPTAGVLRPHPSDPARGLLWSPRGGVSSPRHGAM
ncbi:hypothetical protein [Prauserella muralis]|uniref:Uncharacterized protein n=1 Tax=Prauserella muralis TaxID=588067 RepID=A0A2V4AMQ4_9PSEU|nr:hypothetical protein [Prauserella muralis]PXY21264.1 hypothetical protein BAY60_27825 [Prauserella muralis]